MKLYSYSVKAPGLKSQRLWVDIENVKTPVLPEDAPKGWPDSVPGKPIKNRMKTFMIGVAYVQRERIYFMIAFSKEEDELMDWLDHLIEKSADVAYYSFNRYDELVLEGKWTTARRKRLTEAGPWPHISVKANWVNLYKRGYPVQFIHRLKDIESKAILKADLDNEDEVNLIALHCLRDVAENILIDKDDLDKATEAAVAKILNTEVKL